jgi:peptidyl-prolyl cis-trans isomerase C
MTVASGWRPAVLTLCLGLAFALPSMAQTTFKPLDGATDPVVATIDGVAIHRSDVQDFQRTLPPQFQQLPLEVLFPTLIDRMIDSKLIYSAGLKDKLDSDPDVKARMRQYEERVVQEVYLTRLIEKSVNQEAVRKRYEQEVKTKPAREELSARHILLQTEAQAKEVIAELKKGGDFAELARNRSLDQAGKAQGGDLGFFGREDMVPEFSEAAFKMKDGEVSSVPVRTQFGWHVIKVDSRRTQNRSFDEMRDQLVTDLSQETMTEVVGKLRKDSKIEKFNLDGSPAGAAPAAPGPAQRRR